MKKRLGFEYFASGRGYDKKLGSIPYVKEHGDLNNGKKRKSSEPPVWKSVGQMRNLKISDTEVIKKKRGRHSCSFSAEMQLCLDV